MLQKNTESKIEYKGFCSPHRTLRAVSLRPLGPSESRGLPSRPSDPRGLETASPRRDSGSRSSPRNGPFGIRGSCCCAVLASLARATFFQRHQSSLRRASLQDSLLWRRHSALSRQRSVGSARTRAGPRRIRSLWPCWRPRVPRAPCGRPRILCARLRGVPGRSWLCPGQQCPG